MTSGVISLMVAAMPDFCEALCRRHDRDRFILSLCAPAAARPGLWALYAFNYEIARTREVVTEPALGLIRLQWWREAVDEALRPAAPLYRHEVMRALAPAVRDADLPVADLLALIDARVADVTPGAVSGLAGLADYAVATNAPLLRLAVRLCGQHGATDAQTLRAAAGAYGLTGLLRAHMFHHASGDKPVAGAADRAAVAARAREMLAAARPARGLAGAHVRMAEIALRRAARGESRTAPFLLWRLLFSAR